MANTLELDDVKSLIESGSDLEAKDENSKTALMLAAEGNSLECLEMLLNHGANVNTRSKDGHTALMLAVKNKSKIEIISTLLDSGADIKIEDDWAYTALDHAAFNDYPEAEKLLIEKGADVNRAGGYGRTALMLAAGSNSAEAAKVLLENGAKVDLKDTLKKWTALMHAASRNAPDTIKVLMKNKANANLRTDGDCYNTAITIAASKNSIDALRALIDCGADINVKDNIGSTALDVAKWYVKKHDNKKGSEMINLLNEAKRKRFTRKTLPWIAAGIILLIVFSLISK